MLGLSCAIRRAVERLIVQQQKLTIAGQRHVRFHLDRAHLDRSREGGHGVLGRVAACPAVSDDPEGIGKLHDQAAAPSCVTDSLAVIAVMLTMPRLVVEGARMWAGARAPMSMGPTASALLVSLSSVIDKLALSRLGKIRR